MIKPRPLIAVVDDRDWRTKRAFTAVMFLFTMTEMGGSEKLPLIMITAQ